MLSSTTDYQQLAKCIQETPRELSGRNPSMMMEEVGLDLCRGPTSPAGTPLHSLSSHGTLCSLKQ